MDPKALVYKHAKFKLREARRWRRKARGTYVLYEEYLVIADDLESEANQVLRAIDKWFETL